ncbi:MAG: hypothetical protein NC548_39840 [Lachnospiraceae bacterium]|nr:hypothetical protein [Lachnospiraceae bacterium]
MQLRLDICFHTDGDFHFVEPSSMIDPKYSLYNGAHIEYSWTRADEKFTYHLVATGNDLPCRLAARDLLQRMICNLRTSETHVYLIKDIYEFLSGPIDNGILFDRDKDIDYDDNITGNYEGTYMRLIV